jgi:type 1 glutamine amidotransferase
MTHSHSGIIPRAAADAPITPQEDTSTMPWFKTKTLGEASGKSALVIWGGWRGHQPKACIKRFVPFLKKHHYRVTVKKRLSILADKDKLLGYDLIILCWTMGKLSDTQERCLTEAVAEGVGFAGWHGGMCDAFRTNINYQWMTGGQFVAHPGDIIDYEVKIVDEEDPIMRDISNFNVHSEQYVMHVDPSNTVLATTEFTSEHAPQASRCDMPVVWKRGWGKGRVFYSALGHVASEFDVEEVRTIMERGMIWASR